ncbi:substrate-binding domain-containing protein [Paenibacillus spongiae]|uniref:Substrate-binding domain-containing protein n=1 Tax=Paenibacillus spongiae TaxID=2909671 RepID=A0ABY5S8D8_9BACL|nr:substrate-binding domain-containing protein [Paenibacillus spongiae]UVI30174.1 substrate-binding domain-containing protein [Paenibacillus spongiae]
MSKRNWAPGLIALLLVCCYVLVLVKFFSSTLAIDRLVRQIEPGKAEAATLKHVVLIAQELDNPFWRMVEQGASEAAGQLGMRIDYMGPIRINPSEQMTLLAKSIAARPDAIVLQGISDPDYDRLINQAAEQGIPVIAVDADEPGSRRLAYVGTDNREAGRRMGELVVKGAGGNGRIGVIIGSERADNQRHRLEGFRSVIAMTPGYEIMDVRSSNISRIQAAQQAEAMLHEHKRIGTIVGFSALDAPGILEGIRASGHTDVRVFGFDEVEETRRGLTEGEIQAAIVQQPCEMGAKSVHLLAQYFKGRTTLPERHYIPIHIVDGERMKRAAGSP